MATSTRLRSKPERRINYADKSDSEFEVDVQASPEPVVSTRKRDRSSAAPVDGIHASSKLLDASHKTTPKRVGRIKAGMVVKPKAGPKVRKNAPTPQKKERPMKQECSICVTRKVTTRSFKAPDDVCEHFQSICNLCIAKMLKTKVAERQLGEAELSCPFPKCDHLLDYAALQTIVSKAAFESYDNAVTKHTLSAEESYVACLSATCGLYFSAQACKNTERGKQLVVCPYCYYEICLKCNRPGKSHGKGSCDQVKKAEEELCEKAVKDMGAKPCPSCGVNIQKNGGCDHITCGKCHHNFCWLCLVGYDNNIQHLGNCPHARDQIAIEPGNWVPDNLTDAQINNLITQAAAHLDNTVAAPAPVP
ncbi:hypothetical protein G6011_01329 [Alternaria panax]|uniref:RBR-type E3 ubiquitin transferase n=1 Tax=Alternaria panax TaxID=48097 RepID=A0AAD4NVQ7_9PLEO|nr:hypothetical protein G6011_01329 [Alternaria panax]